MFSYYPPDNRFLSPAAIKELSLEIRYNKNLDSFQLIGKIKTMDGENAEIYLAPIDRQKSIDERVEFLIHKAEEAIRLIGGSTNMVAGVETFIRTELQKAIDETQE